MLLYIFYVVMQALFVLSVHVYNVNCNAKTQMPISSLTKFSPPFTNILNRNSSMEQGYRNIIIAIHVLSSQDGI